MSHSALRCASSPTDARRARAESVRDNILPITLPTPAHAVRDKSSRLLRVRVRGGCAISWFFYSRLTFVETFPKIGLTACLGVLLRRDNGGTVGTIIVHIAPPSVCRNPYERDLDSGVDGMGRIDGWVLAEEKKAVQRPSRVHAPYRRYSSGYPLRNPLLHIPTHAVVTPSTAPTVCIPSTSPPPTVRRPLPPAG
jgi:hypothetical protein